MNNIVIRNGTLVDGTGSAARTADVLVLDGVIRAVGGANEINAAMAEASGPVEEIDAHGLLVTPGWVDIHTHYDGQVTWDDVLAPSAWHGVTTIVTGNCGVGFAPVEPHRREWLIGLMEGVEDIPGTALSEGIQWDWETFPQYLDALDGRSWPMDVGTQIAHGALRSYVMGERGALNQDATAEDIGTMRTMVVEAVEAGALGVSTSRTTGHISIDGEPVPGTFAAEDELLGLARGLSDAGAGIFEVAPLGVAGEDVVKPIHEIDWMARISAETGRPVSFALLQVDDDPDLWRKLLDAANDAVTQGADLWPQVAGRATGLLGGHFTTYCLFDMIPAYQALKARRLDPDAFYQELLDPQVRASIVGWSPPDAETAERMDRAYRTMYVLGDPPDYEPAPERSLSAMAKAAGRDPLDLGYDILLENNGQGLLYVPILNYSQGSLEPAYEMLAHPRSVSGLADGGAHCGVICDASMPTFLLTHWTRDRTRGDKLPLEMIVRKQTRDTARLYGLEDRGTVEVGMIGDLNVIDYQNLALLPPYITRDLPAGGSRILQQASGYVATIKKGEITFRNGEHTGARPGTLVRGPQQPIAQPVS